MITAAKAKALLKPGDCVYIIENRTVQTETIKAIFADSLRTTNGFLYFDEHGHNWWLTKKVAAEKTGGKRYV